MSGKQERPKNRENQLPQERAGEVLTPEQAEKARAERAERQRLAEYNKRKRAIEKSSSSQRAALVDTARRPTATPAAPATGSPERPSSSSTETQINEFLKKMLKPIEDMVGSLKTEWRKFWGALITENKNNTSSSSGDTASGAPSAAPSASGSQTPAARPGRAPITAVEKPAGVDSTWGLKGKDLLKHPDFSRRLDEIAVKIGCSSTDLRAIIQHESGFDPQIVNKISGATGLLQWMPKTAETYGLTTAEIRQMSGLRQLDLVERFFKPYFGKLKSFSDLYRAVFFPASIGKGPDYVFRTRTTSAAKVASSNPSLARLSNRPDGYIDNAGFEKRANQIRPSDSALA